MSDFLKTPLQHHTRYSPGLLNQEAANIKEVPDVPIGPASTSRPSLQPRQGNVGKPSQGIMLFFLLAGGGGGGRQRFFGGFGGSQVVFRLDP